MKALALMSIGLVSGALAAGSYGCGRNQATVTSEARDAAPVAAGERKPSQSTHGPPEPQPRAGEDGSEGQAPSPTPAMETQPAMPGGARARSAAPAAAAGATSSAPTGDMAGAGAAPEPTEDDGPCETRGLQLSGLMYSPGGDRLPHPCKPFHPTENNPFAVRCIDVWPWYDTGFPGDEFCILPPIPGAGVQYGVHPQGPNWYAQVSSGDMSGYERTKLGYFILAQSQRCEGSFLACLSSNSCTWTSLPLSMGKSKYPCPTVTSCRLPRASFKQDPSACWSMSRPAAR